MLDIRNDDTKEERLKKYAEWEEKALMKSGHIIHMVEDEDVYKEGFGDLHTHYLSDIEGCNDFRIVWLGFKTCARVIQDLAKRSYEKKEPILLPGDPIILGRTCVGYAIDDPDEDHYVRLIFTVNPDTNQILDTSTIFAQRLPLIDLMK